MLSIVPSSSWTMICQKPWKVHKIDGLTEELPGLDCGHVELKLPRAGRDIVMGNAVLTDCIVKPGKR